MRDENQRKIAGSKLCPYGERLEKDARGIEMHTTQ